MSPPSDNISAEKLFDGIKIALAGRPNVGKSTLFNRLASRKIALVDDMPGLTRDRREQIISILGYRIQLSDMAGWEEEKDKRETALAKGAMVGAATEEIHQKMRQQINRALDLADIIFFILDGKAGLLPHDEQLAKKLFMLGKPVYALVNKMESQKDAAGLAEFSALGFENIFPISAAHGNGIDALKIAISELAEEYHNNKIGRNAEIAAQETVPEAIEEARDQINLVMMGRPNVGKSTLVNRLIGDERMIVSAQSGTTRDAIAAAFHWGRRKIMLFDTAGLRRRARIFSKAEKISTADALYAIRFAHIVALIVDAEDPLEKQELRLVRHVSDEGRGLMILLNKWDKISDKQAILRQVNDKVETALPMVKNIPIITLSALHDSDFNAIPESAFALYDLWCRRIATPILNRWLAQVTMRHSPPLIRGRRLKLRYITQTKARPPQFHLFASAAVPVDYQRYLIGALRNDFNWYAVPLRLVIRRGNNPYAPEGKSRAKPRRKTSSGIRPKSSPASHSRLPSSSAAKKRKS